MAGTVSLQDFEHIVRKLGLPLHGSDMGAIVNRLGGSGGTIQYSALLSENQADNQDLALSRTQPEQTVAEGLEVEQLSHSRQSHGGRSRSRGRGRDQPDSARYKSPVSSRTIGLS